MGNGWVEAKHKVVAAARGCGLRSSSELLGCLRPGQAQQEKVLGASRRNATRQAAEAGQVPGRMQEKMVFKINGVQPWRCQAGDSD